MASQGRYVAPPPGRVEFLQSTPLTCRVGYGTMSAVDRMGGFRGLVIGLFRLPVRSAFQLRAAQTRSAGVYGFP